MEVTSEDHPSTLLATLRSQQTDGQLCDVTLTAGGASIRAHRCVLAAGSPFFHKLFCGPFGDTNCPEVTLPVEHSSVAEKVVGYLYTGNITATQDEIENVLLLADYLCIDSLRKHASEAISKQLNLDSCIQIWLLAEQYNLDELLAKVRNFMASKTSLVLNHESILQMAYSQLLRLLQESIFAPAKEFDIIDCIVRWTSHEPKVRLEKCPFLLNLTNPKYLSMGQVKKLLGNDYIALSSDLDFTQKCLYALTLLESRGYEDYIVFRSRVTSRGDATRLVSYNITTDTWATIKTPSEKFAEEVVAMAVHEGDLVCLLNKAEDVCGYMHPSVEKKELWQLDLADGEWHQRASIPGLAGQTRLVSHTSGLLALDQYGGVALYKTISNVWHMIGRQGFEADKRTWYTIPMPIDNRLYVLRAYSLGYPCTHAEAGFSLHLFDIEAHTWQLLSDVHATELNLGNKDRMHGYTIQPGTVMLRDEGGKLRAQYDLVLQSWSSFSVEQKIPQFVGDIWGTVEYLDRVYWIGRTKDNAPTFMLYDCSGNKAKQVTDPPCHLSGIACHVRLGENVTFKVIESSPS